MRLRPDGDTVLAAALRAIVAFSDDHFERRLE
jgi:hypothetical protein